VAGEESVEAVLADIEEDEEPEPEGTEHTAREPTPEERRIKELRARVERLEEHNEELEAELAEREETIEEYEQELSAARREERKDARERRDVARLQRETDRLERELEGEREAREELEGKLERLKALWKLDHSNFADFEPEKRDLVPVKPVAEFTRAAILDADERYGLAEGDVVLLRDAGGAGRSTAELLADVAPRVVLLGRGGLSEVADQLLFEHSIPVASAEGVTIREVDELAVARESEVEAAIAEWEQRAEERERRETGEMVDRLISEHRADRDTTPGELLDT
jgi:predicted RNase H-like nuclease (RuvC/YqgF family)